ncbi:MAG: RNA polymerase factor sigma-54 [Pseudomonadota bacterium]
MKQALQLKLGQSLAMTPQLQQAIRLLQLSTLELQAEIQEALESNPLLEVEGEGEAENAGANEQLSAEQQSADEATDLAQSRTEARELEVETAGAEADEPVTEIVTESVDDGFDVLEGFDSTATVEAVESEQMPDDLPVDSAWEDVYEPSFSTPLGRAEDNDRDFTEFHAGDSASLQDHLLEQLYLSKLSEREHQIGAAIIESIDDSGYLTVELQDIFGAGEWPKSDASSQDEIESVLHFIQRLDPVGCGARNAGECMYVQLEHLPASVVRDRAMIVVKDHLKRLANHELPKIRRELRINDAELNEVIDLIRQVNPRPGSQISSDKTHYIVPDVIVRRDRRVWKVELNPEIAPKLGINAMYASLVKRADKSDDNTFIRNHLQEARWFIKSLQSRNETLLRVATAIVEHQRDYFERGEMAMKPLVLRDIAEQLGMHESTISRVTTQKYMHTPRGIHEFKFFFSSHVSTADGGECSATAIRAMIRKLVASESGSQPLSDSKIANTLVADGIKVARRTIAKYRESMAIPPSNERKRLH